MRRTMMRFLAIVIVLGCVRIAAADRGFYIADSLGGGGYSGDLAAYGSGGPRLQVGFGYRRDAWTIEGLGGAVIPDFFFIDCYGEECDVDTSRDGSYGYFGFDLKRSWPVLQSRWSGLNVKFTLHAGPRYFFGDGALRGYQGPGVNGGAAIEANAWVIGYFLDFGVDAMSMSIPVDGMAGVSPHVMFGGKVGWL